MKTILKALTVLLLISWTISDFNQNLKIKKSKYSGYSVE